MKDDDRYLFDRAGEPDPEIAALEAQLRPARYVPATDRAARAASRRPTSAAPDTRSRRRFAIAIGALALAAGAAAIIQGSRAWSQRDVPKTVATARPPTGRPGTLVVTRLTGDPTIDGRSVNPESELGAGEWLDTRSDAAAEIALPAIGAVRVEPASRLRIVVTGPTSQRLELVRGSIEAKVIAPPRLFVVDTPAAQVTDLGCAYRLTVADDGGSVVRVMSGAVELAGSGRSAWVPRGARCETHPGRGPGSPYFEDALDALKDGLRVFDADPGNAPPGTVEGIASAARERDTLTLWHMRERVRGSARDVLTARLDALVPGAKGSDYGRDDFVSHW